MIHYIMSQRPQGLLTVWSLQGNPGMARCQGMSTLPVGYIPQCKVTLASSSGSLGFIVYCRMVDSVPRWQLSLWEPITILANKVRPSVIEDWMILPSWWEHSHGKTQYIPGKKVLVRSCLWKIYFIYYFMCRKMQMCVVWVYDHSKVRMSENPRLPVVIQWTESVPSG